MRTFRHARTAVAVLAAATAPIAAQDDLMSRFTSAVHGPEPAQRVAALGIPGTPARRLLEVFENDSPLFDPVAWQYLHKEIKSRRQDLMRLWHKNRDIRKRYTRFYARMPVDWTPHHVQSGKWKKQEIEAIAAELEYDPRRLEQMQSKDPAVAASATAIHRAASKASIARESQIVHAARRERADARVPISRSNDPFCIGAHMPGAAPNARAEAAGLIRDLLKLPIPPWVQAAGSQNQGPVRSNLLQKPLPTPEQLEVYLQGAERGEFQPLIARGDLRLLSESQRRAAARRLLTISAELPREVRSFRVHMHPRHAFSDALRLDESCLDTLIQQIVQTKSLAHQQDALTSLQQHWNPPDTAPRDLAAKLLPLLDAETGIATIAARYVDRLVDDRCDPAVRAFFFERARKILKTKPDSLTDGDAGSLRLHIGRAPHQRTNTESVIVLIAARLGSGDLFEPLVKRLANVDGPRGSGHTYFLWKALSLLARHTTPREAMKLLALLDGPTTSPDPAQPSIRPHIARLLYGCYGVVPDSELERVEAHLRAIPARSRTSSHPVVAKMAPARIRRLLQQGDLVSALHHDLYAQCPDLLLEAWNRGDQGRATTMLAALIHQDRPSVRPLLLTWPRPLVARALRDARAWQRNDDRSYPRALFERLHDAGLDDDTWSMLLFRCELTADDVATIEKFAHGSNQRRACLAARRLCALSAAGRDATGRDAAGRDAAGRDAARRILDRVLESPEAFACRNALLTAIGLDLSECDWRPAVARLATEQHFEIVVELAQVQFGGVDVMTQKHAASIISTLGLEVDAETLARKPDVDLAKLIPHSFDPRNFVAGSPRPPSKTTIAALTLLTARSTWSQHDRDAVLRATGSPDADVRRAAYEALASRDRELWPSAWLAYEAALDYVPSVHAASPDATRMQESK